MIPMDSKPIDLSVSDLERKLMKVTHKEVAQCENHGPFAAYFTPHLQSGSKCPVCADEAQKIKDAEDRETERQKAAADRIARRLGSAMIPPRFQGKTFESFKVDDEKQAKVLRVCKDYADNFSKHYNEGRSLLLLGNVGTGKTHLAAAIADQVITQQGCTALYRTVYGILQYVKGSFDRESEYNESDAFAAFIEPNLLIIDEVGATKTTEFEQQTLFNIVNGRYEQQIPTIVISNLMPEELVVAMGERCVDRLREGGGIAQIFTWGSVRKSIKFGEDQ
jgi:DNA replication protein DnaC